MHEPTLIATVAIGFVAAFAMGSAHAGFEEKSRGSLEPGKVADLVVLSGDILSEGQRDHIHETTVVLTMVGGKVVYQAPKAK